MQSNPVEFLEFLDEAERSLNIQFEHTPNRLGDDGRGKPWVARITNARMAETMLDRMRYRMVEITAEGETVQQAQAALAQKLSGTHIRYNNAIRNLDGVGRTNKEEWCKVPELTSDATSCLIGSGVAGPLKVLEDAHYTLQRTFKISMGKQDFSKRWTLSYHREPQKQFSVQIGLDETASNEPRATKLQFMPMTNTPVETDTLEFVLGLGQTYHDRVDVVQNVPPPTLGMMKQFDAWLKSTGMSLQHTWYNTDVNGTPMKSGVMGMLAVQNPFDPAGHSFLKQEHSFTHSFGQEIAVVAVELPVIGKHSAHLDQRILRSNTGSIFWAESVRGHKHEFVVP